MEPSFRDFHPYSLAPLHPGFSASPREIVALDAA